MTDRTTDWRKDMPRCEFNSYGLCIANIPKACICMQMAGLKAVRLAFDKVFNDGEFREKAK